MQPEPQLCLHGDPAGLDQGGSHVPDYQDAASQVSRRRGSLACRVLRKEEGTEKEEP